MAGLQHLRRSLRQHLGRHVHDLQTHRHRRRTHPPGHRDRDQRRRRRQSNLRTDHDRHPAAAGQHRPAGDHRHHRRRPDPHFNQRHLDRIPHRLRLPVAGLQQRRRRLHEHHRRDGVHLRARRRRCRTHDPRGCERHKRGRLWLGELGTVLQPSSPPRSRRRTRNSQRSAAPQKKADPHRHTRHLDRIPHRLRLPVAGLQHLRRSLLEHLGRHVHDLQTHRHRRRTHPPGHRDRHQRGRLGQSNLRRERNRHTTAPGEHRPARGDRHARRRPDALDEQRQLDGVTDGLQLPVAGLQQRRRRLLKHLGRRRPPRTSSPPPTSDTRSAPP